MSDSVPSPAMASRQESSAQRPIGSKSYLISTQSYRHESHSSVEVPTPYGYLVETDFNGSRRLLGIPTPTESPFGERIKPGLRGIALWEENVYVATWNAIHVIDYPSFALVDQFSHPLMADLHGIHVDHEGFWITSALIDSLLKFDWKRELQGTLRVSETSLYPRTRRRAIDLGQDYRLRGKVWRGVSCFHVNHVGPCDEEHVFLTGRGDGKKNGRVLRVNRQTLEYSHWVRGLSGAHDGLLFAPGCVALTETNRSTVALVKPFPIPGPRVFRRLKLPRSEARYWTRGLCLTDEGNFLVGRSVWEGDSRLASVVELSPAGECVAEHLLELDDYPECRIFQIIAAPQAAAKR